MVGEAGLEARECCKRQNRPLELSRDVESWKGFGFLVRFGAPSMDSQVSKRAREREVREREARGS